MIKYYRTPSTVSVKYHSAMNRKDNNASQVENFSQAAFETVSELFAASQKGVEDFVAHICLVPTHGFSLDVL